MKRGSELEPELQAFLRSRRVVRRAPPEIRARALMGAQRIVDGAGPLPAAATPASWAPLPRRRPAVRGRLAIRVALAASVVIAAGTVGAVMFVRGRSAPPPLTVPSGSGGPIARPEEPVAEAPDAPPPEAEPRAGTAHRRRAGGGVDPLAAQLELLQRAQAAYTRHDFATALALLAEHARRYPRGHLAEEREALRVRSLLAAGRRPEAQRAATLFARRFPRSVLLPSLQDEDRALE